MAIKVNTPGEYFISDEFKDLSGRKFLAIIPLDLGSVNEVARIPIQSKYSNHKADALAIAQINPLIDIAESFYDHLKKSTVPDDQQGILCNHIKSVLLKAGIEIDHEQV